MCEDLEGLERELFFPTETQLLNDSSAVPPLILWLHDITIRQHVTIAHHFCLAVSSARKNWFSTAALIFKQ